MGATDFITIGSGDSAEVAYREAKRQAQYESGHDSYNGTISTTNGFFMLSTPDGLIKEGKIVRGNLLSFVDENIEKTEKWGNCACISIGEGRYIFFGLAAV
jgi:hypothetical protein